MISPLARTMQFHRDLGRVVIKTEHNIKIHGHRITRDFLGIIDCIAIDPETGEVWATQATDGSHAATRVKKLLNHKIDLPDGGQILAILLMKRADWIVEVHGWAKRGGRGKRKLWSASIAKL